MKMCKYLKLKSRKNVKYFFCDKKEREITRNECVGCVDKEYKKVKPKKSKRAEACGISTRVRGLVWQRDNGRCIICGKRGFPNSHYIRRSHGGLGIEQNIVCMCTSCHNSYDNGKDKKLVNTIREKTKDYLKNYYGDNWSKDDLIYRKGYFG